MNKQQIFSLYLSNPKQKICYDADEVSNYLTGIYLGSKIDEPDVAEWKAVCEDSEPLSLNDCQLILTPISEMKKLNLYEGYKATLNQYRQDNGARVWTPTNQSFLYLITNGIAYSDSLFTDGTAVRG